MPRYIFVDLFDEPIRALCTQVGDGFAHIQVDYSRIVAIQIPIPHGRWEPIDQTMDRGLILWHLPSICLFYEICETGISKYLVSRIFKIDAKFVHPLQYGRIGDIIGLNEQLDRIRAPEDIAHMPEFNQRSKILRHIILEIGIYEDLCICIDTEQ